MATDELEVRLHGQHIGILRRTDQLDNTAAFEYDNTYRHKLDATPLSLSLPLSKASHDAVATSTWLWGLLPDNAITLEQLATRGRVSARDIFGLIRYVGRDVAGAAEFLDPTVAAEPDALIPLNGDELAARIADLRRHAETHAPTVYDNGRWSLPGAQAKIALRYQDDTWFLPEGREPSTHIIKPAIPGYANFDINEAAILTTASGLGLSAAPTTIIELADGTHALVSTRYDRIRTSAGTVTRLHQEDLCQALRVRPGQKYESDGGPGVIKIARILGRAFPDSYDARNRFFDALVLSWAIAGTDGHAKNYSLLLNGANISLAPLYDINSALPYTRPWGHKYRSVKKLHSAQTLGDNNAFTRVSLADWHTVARQLSLPTAGVADTIETLATQVLTTLPTVYDQLADRVHLPDTERIDWVGALTNYHHHLRID